MNKADALPIVWNFKRENAVESKAMVIMTTKFHPTIHVDSCVMILRYKTLVYLRKKETCSSVSPELL